MVLTAAQVTAFFTKANKMAIPAATYAQLQVEGITSVDDLAEFNDGDLKQPAGNLRRPGGGGLPLVFGMKAQSHLKVTCALVRFYETIGRPLTAANIQWTHVMKNFKT